jgi:hypothetical protein
MVTGYETKKIKLNAPLRGYQAGASIPIKVDKDGTPIDRYWRDRLKDAKKDNCVEIVSTKSRTSKKRAEEVNEDANR